MIASIVNSSAYAVVVPSWAIAIASVWAVIVIAAHLYAFVSVKHQAKAK